MGVKQNQVVHTLSWMQWGAEMFKELNKFMASTSGIAPFRQDFI